MPPPFDGPGSVWQAVAVTCPLCDSRRARRTCPALQRDICPVCCGTKRLTEIQCPSGCVWLASSRAHPPAAVLRQRERDWRFLAEVVAPLGQRASAVLALLQDVVRRHERGAIPALHDADVRDAAAALAATYETTARGIIYEHQAASLPAQRLLVEWRAAVEDIVRRAGAGREHLVMADAAAALRRVEWAAREAGTRLGPTDTGYLDLIGRMSQDAPDGPPPSQPAAPDTPQASRLILP